MLKRVAIFSSRMNERTVSVINRLIKDLCIKEVEVYVYDKAGGFDSCPEGSKAQTFADINSLGDKPDLVLSVGGDGTFLKTMMLVKNLSVPVAGVNTGKLGFLANISEDDLCQSLELIYRNDYDIIERSLLEITEPEGLFSGCEPVALNEITMQKAGLSMITVTVYVDEIYLNTYRADGLIVSTATGSTAYNLSAGGPILPPGDEGIIISPLSAHNLTVRPIVLPGYSKLRMVAEGRSSEYLATCDFRSVRFPFSQQLKIRKAQAKLKTVMLRGRDFYSTLRDKLMWGADIRN